MKKKYISPQTNCSDMATELPLATSRLSIDNGDSQIITVSNDEADEFTSRRSSMWDEEDF